MTPPKIVRSAPDDVPACEWRRGVGRKICFCHHPDHGGRPVGYDVCRSCPLDKAHNGHLPDTATTWRLVNDPACLHRGDVLRSEPCSCPHRGPTPVHACALFTECVLSNADRERVRSQSVPIKSCQNCPAQLTGARRTPPAPPESRVRVGILSPCLAVGGVERWLATVARLAFHVEWVGVAMHGRKESVIDARSYRELAGLLPITFDRRQVLDAAEVLLIWAEPPAPDLADWPGKLVHVIHGESDWSRHMATHHAARLDHVLAVSPAAARVAPPGVPLTITPNILDGARLIPSADRETLRHRHAIHGRLAVCYVGRFHPDKDPLVAARAAAELGGVAVYCAVGPRGWESQVRAVCPDLVLIDPTRPADAFALADCFAMGSRAEGFGFTFVESLALGCPVVARPAGVLRTWPETGTPRAYTDLDDYPTPGQAVLAALETADLAIDRRDAPTHAELMQARAWRDFVREEPGDCCEPFEHALLDLVGRPAVGCPGHP